MGAVAQGKVTATGLAARPIPKRSASLPGSRSRRPSAHPADAATSLPTRDELAARLDRKTPAVTERGRSMVRAHTKNRRSARLTPQQFFVRRRLVMDNGAR